jgi:hypothetical protein
VLDLHFNNAAMIAFGHLAGAQRNKGNYFTASSAPKTNCTVSVLRLSFFQRKAAVCVQERDQVWRCDFIVSAAASGHCTGAGRRITHMPACIALKVYHKQIFI